MPVPRKTRTNDDHGIGTPIAEYIETGAPTSCGNCYFIKPYSQKRGACNEKHVMRDPKIKKLADGTGDVSSTTGCCRFWYPQE